MRAALLLLLLGCSADPITEIVLTVDQVGINVGRDIDTIHINIGTDKFSPENFLSIGVALCAALPTSGCHDLPLTATLIPGKNMPTDNVRAEVQAKLHGDGTNSVVRIRDVARFHFTRGESLRLELVLTPNCLDDPLHCADAELACAQQGCYSPTPVAPGADLAVQLDLSTPPDLAGVDLKDVDFACRPTCAAGYCGPDGCNGACKCDSQAFMTCGGSMMCVSCGADNQPCCPTSPRCQTPKFNCDQPDITGKCVPCAGQGVSCSGQPCCAGSVCGPSQTCVSCGHQGEPCCADTPSCNSNLTCTLGQCQPCGTSSLPCCQNGVDLSCQAGSFCVSDTCQPCGLSGQTCCGGMCSNMPSIGCNSTNDCAPCGSPVGAACCGGNVCSGMLACDNGFCSACGQNTGDPCCPNGSCGGNLVCWLGHCYPPDMAWGGDMRWGGDMTVVGSCGNKDESCCVIPSTPPCNFPWLICAGTSPPPTCQCGGAGQPCCQDIVPFYCKNIGYSCDYTVPSVPPVCNMNPPLCAPTTPGMCGDNCCYNSMQGRCAPGFFCCPGPGDCAGGMCTGGPGQCFQ